MFAQDIMNTDITTISADSSVHQAIDLMVAKDISGLPVIDNDGNLCGLLTEGDLMRRIEFGGGRSAGNSDNASLVDFDDYIRSRSWRVSDVMSASVISVAPDAPAAAIAELMFQHKIKRVPVVSDKRLLGIVSRVDLLKAIVAAPKERTASGDDALARAIRARLQGDLGLETDAIKVSVQDSRAILEGTVSSELERRAIRVLVENVKGVDGFIDKLNLT
ncbi:MULTISPECIES: CBS domain-containing protein [unclassified Rhizobium]|jgi:CBS domain-containing protein|uniref:CBS domain-containing protein n=2 Tax=unclassified Rhizobium TaxID=2613769 RepID=UPI001612728B|nr:MULTISPECIES: CBS domain-containing protein [unclassified Rhizobium]MBB3317737.1 CBS domain-containing protein [Rhizobium sp. BK181]MBB3542148.1 CBS domain-containing protein [Rhizobium sp. BK399]MCS3740272.1 CBS domain-containing protein [Rhizobium sp. BK661]